MAAFGAANASAAATASVTKNLNKSSSYLCRRHGSYLSSSDKVTLRLSARPELRFSSKGLQSGWNCSTVVKAQSNEVRFSPWIPIEQLFSKFRSFVETLLEPSVTFKVTVDASSRTAASTNVPSEGSLTEAKDVKLSNEPPPAALRSEESISKFISQVSSLVKLVDSKDIVELQLRQLDSEILIRKMEALSPPPSPIHYIQTQSEPAVAPPAPTVSTVPTATPSPQPTQAPALPKAPIASHPPLKCPMAGTFYRSPAPGEPPFVKVGDKVKKGQVLCIIEAMKLMNEIEADTSGTLVEILAEDGKPVSVAMPLFVIQP